VACGSDSTTAPSGPPQIGGVWGLSVNYSNSLLAASCFTTQGTVGFAQTGTTFTATAQSGSANCTFGGAPSVESIVGTTFTGGQISGSSVTMTSGSCVYSGSITGSPPNKMSGTVSCQMAISGSTYLLTGNWSASR
jgi:hypothetical protein